jgi:hypothetical protein
MADFFREVDEEVRRDRVLKFWQRYQNWLIGGALLIVVGTGAWRLYENNRLSTAEAAGARYEAALRALANGNTDEAQSTLAALETDKSQGYAILARFLEADLIAAKDPEAGVKAYEALAADPHVGSAMQAAAQVRAAIIWVDREDAKKFIFRFTPYAAPGKPFANTYRELIALAALKEGDYDTAGKWLDQIVVDGNAPPGVRNRAQALLGLVRAGKLPSQ